MKTVSISILKASLSEYLEAVRRGEEVIVTDRGRPVARLLPVPSSNGRWERLIREGILSPPRKARTGKLTPPRGKKRAGVLSALLEERAEGR
jgi:prevent-host-death family protein